MKYLKFYKRNEKPDHVSCIEDYHQRIFVNEDEIKDMLESV